jgi:hypothetical protein
VIDSQISNRHVYWTHCICATHPHLALAFTGIWRLSGALAWKVLVKSFGHHPVIAACDNTTEPLAWMLRPARPGRTRPLISRGCWRRPSPRCRRRCAGT